MHRLTVRMAVASALSAAALISVPATADAAGFFESIFGLAAPAPAPVYSYEPAPADEAPAPVHVRRARRIVDDAKPVLQKTTDLLHDKTLRAGDAVMTKTGIEVYEGGQGSRHSYSQFTPLDDASLSKTERKTLLAMDETRHDPREYAAGAGTVHEGRSVAEGPEINAGYKITDVRGRSIRYVGP